MLLVLQKHPITVILATNLDGRIKRSLTYLVKTINVFDDSLQEMKTNIDHCRSEESERLQDSNENAVQLPNERLKLSGKANSKHKTS